MSDHGSTRHDEWDDGDRLDPSIIAGIDSVEPPAATDGFWSAVDQRLDAIDRETTIDGRGEVGRTPATATNPPFGPSDPGLTPGEEHPVDVDFGESIGSNRSGRARFLAVAAAVVVAFAGLAWVLGSSFVSEDPADQPEGDLLGQSPVEPNVLEAEDMAVKIAGEESPGVWSIWRSGYIEDEVVFSQTGTYEFVVIARGRFDAGGDVGPDMELLVDSITVEPIQVVRMDVSAPYRFVVEVEAGTHRVAVSNTLLSEPSRPTDERGQGPELVIDRIEIVLVGN